MSKLTVLRGLIFVCALVAVDANAAVRICHTQGADVFVDNTGVTPASMGFRKCVADPTVMLIELPPGIYLVDIPIKITHSNLTIRTAQLAGNIRNCQQLGDAGCAVFLASPDPKACINTAATCPRIPGTTKIEDPENGLLQVDGTPAQGVTNVILDHITIDGNRVNRQNTQAKWHCDGENQFPVTSRFGFNSHMSCIGSSTSRCEFTFNFTRNALCGTGLEFVGDFGRVQGNAAFNNGVHSRLLWADGLTVVDADHGIISDNHVVNNSDVGLIVGSCAGGTISGNWVQQTSVYAFAGLMLGNFCEGGQCRDGNYFGTSIKANTIQCNAQLCGFGINFGPDPWIAAGVQQPNVIGGQVTQNNVSGARVLVNFGGAGNSTAAPPADCLHSPPTSYTCFAGNTLTNPPGNSMPVGTDARCTALAKVLINLPYNKTNNPCGNYVTTDVSAASTSTSCFNACFANQAK